MINIKDCINKAKKLEIEFEDESGKIFYIKSDIKKREFNKILISAPVYNNCCQILPLDSRINIIIRTNDAVFLGISNILSAHELNNEPHYWITIPEHNQFLDQRKYVRVPMSIKVKLLIFENIESFIFKELDLYSRDICAGGFSFLSDYPLSNDYEDMAVEIYLEDNINEPLVSKCSYVYTKSIEIWSSAKTRYINAISFNNFEQKYIDRIQKACFKFQLKSKTK